MKINIFVICVIINFALSAFPFNVGYSDASQQIKGMDCFQKFEFDIISQKTNRFINKVPFTQIENTFKPSVNSSEGIKMFNFSLSQSFLSSLKKDDSKGDTVELNFYFEHVKKIDMLIEGQGEELLSEMGETLYANGKNEYFGLLCGNKLIDTAEIGAILALHLSLTINEVHKSPLIQNYLANVDADNSIQKITEIVQSSGITGSLSIKAIQIGGDAHKIGNILTKDQSGNYYAVRCELRNMLACQGAISGLLNYARNSFIPNVEDVENIQKLVLLRENFTTVSLSKYGLEVPIYQIKKEDMEIRNAIESMYKESLYYIEKTNNIIAILPNNVTGYSDIISAAKEINSLANFRKRQFDDPTFEYSIDIKSCYDFPDQCNNVMASLFNVKCVINKALFAKISKVGDVYPGLAVNYYCKY